jgi:hypothetical protein
MKSLFRLLGALVTVLALMGGLVAYAQEDNATTIRLNAEGMTIPAELPQGIVTLTFANESDAPFSPLLARLNADVTQDAFTEALSGGPEAALGLVSLLGGTEAAPGENTTVTYDLKAGNHVVLNFAGEAPDVQFFTVSDANTSTETAPEADIQVRLLDFAFTLPVTLPAGEHTWQIVNEGTQWHEMAIMPLPADTTIADYRAMMNGMFSGEGEPPQPAAFWQPNNQGEQAWVTWNLEPGFYVVACFLPDFATGHVHANEGMVQIIEVTAAS